MPDISKFKSVSVSTSTHTDLVSMAKKRFEVPVSIQKVIEFLLDKERKKTNGKSNGRARR
tara:strand:+ start:331 stop:510 length:180 start_codon:yes stop_codon:yes gene_type:complete